MAVVVEQTIPFTPGDLDLRNPSRWNDLFPLLRPTVQNISSLTGQHILVDEALAKTKNVHFVAIGNRGNFSSKLLDYYDVVTAIVTEDTDNGATRVTSEDILRAIRSLGAASDHAVVIVRAGKKRRVEVLGKDVVEVETQGELELDHVLHLASSVSASNRTSISHVTDMLKQFVSTVDSAHIKFQTEKAGGQPAVSHLHGISGYEKARHVVEREVKQVMQAHNGRNESLVYSVHYSDVNGLSRLENYLIAGEIGKHLESQHIPYILSHSTILNHVDNARGFSISLAAIDAQHVNPQPKPRSHQAAPTINGVSSANVIATAAPKMTFDDAEVRKRIQTGCQAVITEEPTITEYDTIVGDGDCGYTLRDGAKQVLAFIEGKDLSRLPDTVAALVQDLEVNMGGTSGALYCIYLTALAAALASETSLPAALKQALGQLMKYTRARRGDRTMMDALIPFIDTLVETGDAGRAVERSREGVEGTKKMEAKLGRSTYLDDAATQGVPDPGAYGLWVLLQGMSGVE